MDRRERLRKLALETIDLAKVRTLGYSPLLLPDTTHFVAVRILTSSATTWDLSNVVCV